MADIFYSIYAINLPSYFSNRFCYISRILQNDKTCK